MAVAKLTCPACGAVLRPTKPVPAGKKVTCPRCSEVFLAEDEEEVRVTARKPAAGKTSDEDDRVTRGKAPKKPVVAEVVPLADDDDEELGGTYGVERSPDEEEEDPRDRRRGKTPAKKKPNIEYVPDLTVKDPRGPATAQLMQPSNIMMFMGALNVVAGMVWLAVKWWPVMFTQYGTLVDPGKIRKEFTAKQGNVQQQHAKPVDDDKPVPVVKLEDLNQEERAEFDSRVDEEWIDRWIYTAACGFSIPYFAIICIGAVKMQNLESYKWAMTACIMSIINANLLGLIGGIMGLTRLKKPEVKAAFEYKSD
jgi:hypothetical protein